MLGDLLKQLDQMTGLDNVSPTQVLLLTGVTVGICMHYFEKYYQNRAIIDRPAFRQNYFYETLRQMPGVGALLEGVIQKDLNKERQDMIKKNAEHQLAHPRQELNDLPLLQKDLTERYQEWHKPFQEVKKNPDKVSGELYMQHGEEYYKGLEKLITTGFYNPLHPDSAINMTREQARYAGILRKWFHGDPEYFSVVITPGGSYSLIEAFKTYVLFGRNVRGILKPELIIPNTIHAAIATKAEELIGVKIHLVPVDPLTGRADVKAMESKINSNTVAFFSSAPNFMNGAIDDIELLGEVAYKHSIGLHVDSCLGGRVTAHLPEKFKLDFRVKGVTSISSDDHKYGGSPKGFSVLMLGAIRLERGYASKMIAKMAYQLSTLSSNMGISLNNFTQTALLVEQEGLTYRLGESCMNLNKDWPGGLYASVGMTSSAAFFHLISGLYTLDFYGEQYYIDMAKSLIQLREKLENKFRGPHPQLETGDLIVLGQPESTVLAFGSETLNAHCIAETMRANGWDVSILQKPDSLHIAFTSSHLHYKTVDQAVKIAEEALLTATLAIKQIPREKQIPKAGAAAYTTIRSIPTLLGEPVVRRVVFDHFHYQQDREYTASGQLHEPERTVGQLAWTENKRRGNLRQN